MKTKALSVLTTLACAALVGTAISATALAGDHWDRHHHRGWYDHYGYWHAGPRVIIAQPPAIYAPPPPVVYAPPPVAYYAPPPVVYAPPPAPSATFVFPLNFR